MKNSYTEDLLGYEYHLKSSRTQLSLNKEGQFFTPYDLAKQIIMYTLPQINLNEEIKYLEPAFGNGSFYNCLLEVIGRNKIMSAVGIEKDEEIFSFSKQVWSKENIDLINNDFTKVEPIQKFNLLITNPPYVRHQHISLEDKRRMKRKVKKELNINVSGYAGLYVYFILLADKFLDEDAIATWLIPAEFMSASYGESLIRYFTETVELQKIHLFEADNSKFDDASVSSVVITYKKRKPREDVLVNLSYGIDVLYSTVRLIPLDILKSGERWINIIKSKSTLHENEMPKLGDFFNISRGIATGDNALFLIDQQSADKLELSKEYYSYIIPSSRYLKSNVIESDEMGRPMVEPSKVLINTALAMEELKIKSPKLYTYLQKAEEEGKNNGYLLKKRNPWYKQEKRDPAPFLCTYMGRNNKKNGKSFNIYKNLSKGIVTNNYLMLYPKEPLKSLMEENPSAIDEVFLILSNLNQDHYSNYGREYGGGLKKVEPRELANIPAPGLADYVNRRKSNYLHRQQLLF